MKNKKRLTYRERHPPSSPRVNPITGSMKFDAKHPITAMWLLLAQELSEKYELSEDLVQIFRTTFYAGGAAVVQLFVEPLLKEKPAEADQPEVVLQILRRIASDVLNGMQQ